MELVKYNIVLAVLCETRFLVSGNIHDLREAGVGFAIKMDIVAKLTEMPYPVSDRILTMRIHLTKDRNATWSVHMPQH